MIDINIDTLTSDTAEVVTPTGADELPYWNGDGIFDKLINAVNKNIEIQYDANRIDGKTFAEVYLGSMQAVLAQSMQFVLQEKQIEADIAIKEEELELKRIQKVLVERQITQIENDIELANSEDTRKQTQLDDQLLTSAKQREQTDKQIDQIENDIELANNNDTRQQTQLDDTLLTTAKQRRQIDSSIVQTERQVSQIEANIEELVKESDRKTRTVQAQIDKLVVDSTLTERHVAKAEKDIEIADEQLSIAKAEVLLKEKSLDKLVSDIALTSRQVSLTEAQTTEQLTDTGRKTNWSNKDLKVKDAEIANRERATSKLEKDIEVTERQMSETELTGNLQRELLNIQTSSEEAKLFVDYGAKVDAYGVVSYCDTDDTLARQRVEEIKNNIELSKVKSEIDKVTAMSMYNAKFDGSTGAGSIVASTDPSLDNATTKLNVEIHNAKSARTSATAATTNATTSANTAADNATTNATLTGYKKSQAGWSNALASAQIVGYSNDMAYKEAKLKQEYIAMAMASQYYESSATPDESTVSFTYACTSSASLNTCPSSSSD